jgi:hypothetical protein
MRCRLLLVPAMALALFAGACGDDDQQARTIGASTSSSSPTSTTADGAQDPSTGDDEPGGIPSDDQVVITLDQHGGFVPVEHSVGNTAEVVVLADGRVISGAPMTMQYPGPALLPFQVSEAGRRAVETVVEEFEALDPDADYDGGAQTFVADAATTTVTLHRDGRTVSISAYALGMTDDVGGPPRYAFQALVGHIQDLVTGTGDTPYEPSALRVHDVTDQVGPPPEPPPGEPSGTVRDWPIPHAGVACSVVSDPAQVRAALGVLRESTQLDRFRTGAGVRRLVVVPLLPGDPGCPER